MNRFVLAAALAAAALGTTAPAGAECADAGAARGCVTAYYTDGHHCVHVSGAVAGQPVATWPCR